VATRIELQIDELVLHGLSHGDRHAIAAAMEREWSQLLMQPGAAHLLDGQASRLHLDAGQFDTAAHARPDSIGAAAAQTIYGGLVK
jgi:hypothetical protein